MSGEEVRRRWRTLTEEQTDVAQAILERAVELYGSIENLSLREALDLAAAEVGRRRERAAQERVRGLS